MNYEFVCFKTAGIGLFTNDLTYTVKSSAKSLATFSNKLDYLTRVFDWSQLGHNILACTSHIKSFILYTGPSLNVFVYSRMSINVRIKRQTLRIFSDSTIRRFGFGG